LGPSQKGLHPSWCPKLVTGLVATSVEQIGDFWNHTPVQNFVSVIRSDPNPVHLSKYLIQSGLYPTETSD